jgi:hypothetical protein
VQCRARQRVTHATATTFTFATGAVKNAVLLLLSSRCTSTSDTSLLKHPFTGYIE